MEEGSEREGRSREPREGSGDEDKANHFSPVNRYLKPN